VTKNLKEKRRKCDPEKKYLKKIWTPKLTLKYRLKNSQPQTELGSKGKGKWIKGKKWLK